MTEHRPRRPRLRRKEASSYLKTEWGLTLAPQTLARFACEGKGPSFQKFGATPVYDPADLDEWAEKRLGPKVRSLTEHKALTHAPA